MQSTSGEYVTEEEVFKTPFGRQDNVNLILDVMSNCTIYLELGDEQSRLSRKLISVDECKSFLIMFTYFHTLVKRNHHHDAQTLGGIRRTLLAKEI